MAAEHPASWVRHMYSSNKISPELRATASSLGVGESSGGLGCLAHCYLVRQQVSVQPHLQQVAFMLGSRVGNDTC